MAKPNFVLIMADDMGYGDFGVFSEGRVRTPFLDLADPRERVPLSELHRKPGMLALPRRNADWQVSDQNRSRHPAGNFGIRPHRSPERRPSAISSKPTATLPASSASGITARLIRVTTRTPEVSMSSPAFAAVGLTTGTTTSTATDRWCHQTGLI